MTTAVTQTGSQQILSNLARKTETKKTSEADDQQSRFLRLLTTQLRNQDPLNPTDSAQTTSQLAQISTVDGVERLNKTLGQMAAAFKSNESLQAAALVGRQVLVEGKAMQLQQGMALGGVDLAAPADNVVVTIFDANNIEVERRDLGGMDAGSQLFVWDGKTSNGSKAADGNYTIKVSATRGGEKVDAKPLQMATVSSLVTGGGELAIDLGAYGLVRMNDIRRIL